MIRRHDGDSAVSLVDSGGATSDADRPGLLRRVGIDISIHRSKSVEEFTGEQFDYVITVCDNAEESCPVFPGNAVRIHQTF
jgi:arsenate reductase